SSAALDQRKLVAVGRVVHDRRFLAGHNVVPDQRRTARIIVDRVVIGVPEEVAGGLDPAGYHLSGFGIDDVERTVRGVGHQVLVVGAQGIVGRIGVVNTRIGKHLHGASEVRVDVGCADGRGLEVAGRLLVRNGAHGGIDVAAGFGAIVGSGKVADH